METVTPAWEIAWLRSLRIQRELRDQAEAEQRRGMAILAANTTTQERAQREYDNCRRRPA